MRRMLVPTLVIALLSLAALEGLLRISGFALRLATDDRMHATFEPGEVRILALGESTSAPIVAGGADFAWPGRLKKILEERFPGKSFSVYNLAASGSTTTMLLRAARKAIPIFRPHLVIGMMGVNDNSTVEALSDPPPLLKISKLWQEVKRQRAWARTQEFYNCHEQLMPADMPSGQVHEMLTIARNANDPIGAVKEKFGREYAGKPAGLFMAAGFLLWHGAPAYGIPAEIDLPRANQFFQAAYRIRPRCTSSVLYSLFGFGLIQDGRSCQLRLLQLHREGISLSDEYLRTLGECTEQDPHDDAIAVLNEYRLRPGSRRPIELTIENLRTLSRLAQTDGFKLAILPYPRIPADNYRALFTARPTPSQRELKRYLVESVEPVAQTEILPEFKSVAFLDNASRFETKLRTQPVGDFFVDLFGIRFGHATAQGHELIAQSVADQLESANFFKKHIHPPVSNRDETAP